MSQLFVTLLAGHGLTRIEVGETTTGPFVAAMAINGNVTLGSGTAMQIGDAYEDDDQFTQDVIYPGPFDAIHNKAGGVIVAFRKTR